MKKVIGFISGLLALIGMALFFILPGWYVAGAVLFGFSIIVAIVDSVKKRHETKCSKCKKKYDYDTDVEWRLVKREVKGGSSATETLARTFFIYDITCSCSKCGKIKKYRKKIAGPSVNNKCELNEVNPEYVLEERFGEPTPVGCGTCFFMLLWAIGFALGGLFFGGYLNGVSSDIDVPGITQVELGEDPCDYYGTYYYIEDSTLVTVVIDADKCMITQSNGIETKTEGGTYEFASAEYVARNYPTAEYKLDSLLVYTNAEKTQAWILAIMKAEDGSYRFRTPEGRLAESKVLTLADVTNDPKDYYGTYRLDNFYITLNEDGSAVMDLGEGAEQYQYMYANGSYLSRWYSKSYNAGIVLTQVGSDGVIILRYQNGSLILQDTYTFTK